MIITITGTTAGIRGTAMTGAVTTGTAILPITDSSTDDSSTTRTIFKEPIMSSHSLRIALSLAPLSLALGCAIAHAAPPAAAAGTAATAADDENSADQQGRRDRYIKRSFERFDTNKDGEIDADEFHAGLEKFLDRQRAAFNRDFDASDANHDGKLSGEEVQKANPTLYQQFSDVDTNDDGFLSKSEIRASIREQQMHVTVEGDTQTPDSPGNTPEGK
jgi:hypothetical protein